MRDIRRSFRPLAWLMVMLISAAYTVNSSAEENLQQVNASVTPAIISPGLSGTVSFSYGTVPLNRKTPGIVLKVFFDSSVASVTSPQPAESLNPFLMGFTPSAYDDLQDLDSNPDTDKYFIFTWLSAEGEFPSIVGDTVALLDLTVERADPTITATSLLSMLVESAPGFSASADTVEIVFDDDSDADGINNATDPDDDNDGVADAVDAFPLISLGSRLDSDADGRPNICDTACLNLGMSEDTDDDNDGVLDDEDRFPLDARYALDADADTMADEWELYFTLDPTNHRDAYFDLDQDGYLNWEEFYADTDPTIASGPAQVLYTDRAATLIPGSSARLSVRYTTTDTDPNLSGMGVRVHYNSKYLTAISLENIFETSLLSVGEPVEDSFDLDGDAETDSYILVAWVSFSGPTWPGELGQVLFDVVLSTTSEIAELEEYPIRFSVSDTPTGYNLSAPSIYNPVVLASLDIDGDGEAKALTDGLMIIRRLFGFSGNSLSAGAVAASATYTTSAELAARIDAFATGLDIDGDGETKALTDGLMIIRRLFGFSGTSLIAGAVSATATRTQSVEIATYIDSLVP